MSEPLPSDADRIAQLERRLEAAERRHAQIIEAFAGELKALSDRLDALSPTTENGK